MLRFQKNSTNSVAPDTLADDIDVQDMTLLFVGDNVDHSILTTDGKGSFHGMGIIAALTPRWKRDSIIPRRDITNLDLPMQSKIPLIKYRFVKHMRLTRTSQNWSTGTELFMSSGSSH